MASWSVDRLGRSLIDLVSLPKELDSTGIDLSLHKPAINTTTQPGKAMFQMMVVFSKLEREIFRERVLAGLAVVEESGKNKHGDRVTLGRPTVSARAERQVRALTDKGMGILKIAKTVGCGVSVVQMLVANRRSLDWRGWRDLVEPTLGGRRCIGISSTSAGFLD